MIRFLTAGESHGKCLTAIVEGFPSNLSIDLKKINRKLAERQGGYGRGGRMRIETDTVEILSGVRGGKTLGSPIALKIENKDWANWKDTMDPENISMIEEVTKPRPGHSDLSGAIKYNHIDIRNVLERASARETAIRVAVGSLCQHLLEDFGIRLFGYVIQIGNVRSSANFNRQLFMDRMKSSELRCLDSEAEGDMIKFIDDAKKNGDSVGGVVEVVATGVPVGLGSHVHWDRKLDARIAGALMSIQAIKGVEFGLGFKSAELPGSQVHDQIVFESERGYVRTTNNSGGIEGGMTNGEDIVVRAFMKPIPTLYKPLKTVDINSKTVHEASVERSDICAVPAASVVAECTMAWEIASAMLEKFAGDSIEEMKRNYDEYMKYVKSR